VPLDAKVELLVRLRVDDQDADARADIDRVKCWLDADA
jgi:hypothetical protein